jgi:phosphohistidine phosphatase
MKRLMLLRHAKSSWDDKKLADHERPLNQRGRKDAPRVGQELQTTRRIPDRIVSSNAQRALQTARELAASCGYSGEIETRGDLYLASPAQYFQVIAGFPEGVEFPLLVGHNPGLEDLVARWSGRSLHLPTACLLEVELAVEHWADCSEATRATLVAAWAPKRGWFEGGSETGANG